MLLVQIGLGDPVRTGRGEIRVYEWFGCLVCASGRAKERKAEHSRMLWSCANRSVWTLLWRRHQQTKQVDVTKSSGITFGHHLPKYLDRKGSILQIIFLSWREPVFYISTPLPANTHPYWKYGKSRQSIVVWPRRVFVPKLAWPSSAQKSSAMDWIVILGLNRGLFTKVTRLWIWVISPFFMTSAHLCAFADGALLRIWKSLEDLGAMHQVVWEAIFMVPVCFNQL